MPAQAKNYLTVNDLCKHYGEDEARITVLNSLSVSINKGEICVLLGLAVSIFLVFMYLLTKTVIDSSSRAISYMKVFGYADREINHLYIRSITWTVAGSLVLSLPLILASLTAIFKAMLMEYNGNITIYTPAEDLAICVAVGLATYAVVAFLHTRRIKRVPLALALKVQE